jgi:hypothetical protein
VKVSMEFIFEGDLKRMLETFARSFSMIECIYLLTLSPLQGWSLSTRPVVHGCDPWACDSVVHPRMGSEDDICFHSILRVPRRQAWRW